MKNIKPLEFCKKENQSPLSGHRLKVGRERVRVRALTLSHLPCAIRPNPHPGYPWVPLQGEGSNLQFAICNLQFAISIPPGFRARSRSCGDRLADAGLFHLFGIDAHRKKSGHHRRAQAQALAAADSGVQMTRIFLLKDTTTQNQAGGWYDNPSLFCGSPVVNDTNPAARIKVTIVAPLLLNGIPGGGIRYGLENESAKLNINNILNFDKSSKTSSQSGSTTTGTTTTATTTAPTNYHCRTTSTAPLPASGTTSGSSATGAEAILMNLPGMTQDIADSILDWIDTDDQPREYGAETEYYSTLTPPYLPKNGPLSTLEELLLVKGVTPALLFGCDINRNGRIDVDESANVNLPGVDNSDGSMNQGWSPYLTLYSKEKNVQSNGQPKINLNESDLQKLSTDLQSAQLSDDQIQFILAYRVYTHTDPSSSSGGSGSRASFRHSPRSSSSNRSAGSSSGSAISDLITKASTTQISSILDLIGAKVQIPAQGSGSSQTKATTLPSPFTNSTGDMTSYLPMLMDCTTVNTAPGDCRTDKHKSGPQGSVDDHTRHDLRHRR